MSPDREADWGAIPNGLVAVQGDRIAWVGPEAEAPPELIATPSSEIDLAGGWVTPGLIDAHTHLVFGGNRAGEFEQRLEGATYEEIARAGGGILSSVVGTRAATGADLRRTGGRRLGWLVDHGCTTVEIKSGYGLDVDTELRMLSVARALAGEQGIAVSTTLLGAHALPREFQHDRTGYVDLVCEEMIPEAARRGVADAVDAFCEGIAFTYDECERVLRAGADVGLGLRLHADQLSDTGGAGLAAELGARSADHLEYTSRAGAVAMAAAGTTAVLLPGAYYFLGETRKPPVDAFRETGVSMAVATDMNPGSSPLASPLLAMNMASVLFGLTPEEALAGMTRNAAPVLGLGDRGTLETGRRADLACWSVDTPAELVYWMGANPSAAVVSGGVRVR
jgi:imidazolonepropionase